MGPFSIHPNGRSVGPTFSEINDSAALHLVFDFPSECRLPGRDSHVFEGGLYYRCVSDLSYNEMPPTIDDARSCVAGCVTIACVSGVSVCRAHSDLPIAIVAGALLTAKPNRSPMHSTTEG